MPGRGQEQHFVARLNTGHAMHPLKMRVRHVLRDTRAPRRAFNIRQMSTKAGVSLPEARTAAHH